MVEVTVQMRHGAHMPRQLLGLEVLRIFPNATDTGMRSWLRLVVPEERDADQVVRELIERPDVEAAYVKPPESTP